MPRKKARAASKNEQAKDLPEVLEQTEPNPEPEPEPEKPDPKPAEPETKPKIVEFLWNGITRFRCSQCHFDSATEAGAYRHFTTNHMVAEKPQEVMQIDTGLISPSGDKIVRLEEAHNGENSFDAGSSA